MQSIECTPQNFLQSPFQLCTILAGYALPSTALFRITRSDRHHTSQKNWDNNNCVLAQGCSMLQPLAAFPPSSTSCPESDLTARRLSGASASTPLPLTPTLLRNRHNALRWISRKPHRRQKLGFALRTQAVYTGGEELHKDSNSAMECFDRAT